MKKINYSRLFLRIRIPCIVIIAFLATWILVYDVSQISYFAPAEKASDFETSDFYQLVEKSRPVNKFCEEIVIVPIDSLSRAEIASVIEELGSYQPSVIGIDLLWNFPQVGVDSFLVEILSELPCAVVVPDNASYIYRDVEGLLQGDVTLNDDGGRVVRRLSGPESFSWVIAEKMRKEPLKSKPNDLIRYGAYDFNIVSPDCIDEFGSEMRGKAVLVGTLNDESDMHPTPVSASMSGLMIHADSVATLLDSNRLVSSPPWFDWILSILFCSLFVWLSLRSKTWRGGDLIMRLCQFFFLIFIIFFGTAIFLAFDFSINFSRPLLIVASSALAVDIWLGAEQLLFKKK